MRWYFEKNILYFKFFFYCFFFCVPGECHICTLIYILVILLIVVYEYIDVSSANVYDICKYIWQHCNASFAPLYARSIGAGVCLLPSM